MGDGFFGSLLGGAVSAVGSLVSGNQNKKALAEANRQNYLAQKEFAQNGISWRVADAQRAGIHPIYALGAGGANFSPSFNAFNDNSASNAFNSIGQAISTYQTKEQRVFEGLKLENAKLQNDMLKAQIENEKNLSKMGQSPAGSAINEALNKATKVENATLTSPKAIKSFHKAIKNQSPLDTVAQQFGVSLERRPNGDILVRPDPDSVSGQAYTEGYLNQAIWQLQNYGYTKKIVKALNDSSFDKDFKYDYGIGLDGVYIYKKKRKWSSVK